MSYASSDKNFSTLWKRLPQKLSHPTAIAVIASVGIHAALGLSLPYLPISSQEKPKPVRNVQLLELKPDELNRLPESPLALAPLPPGLNQQLKPLPSSPSDSSSVRGIPALPSTDPSLSDLSSLNGSLPSIEGASGRVRRQSTNLDKTVRVKSSLLNDLKTKEPPLPSEVFNSQGGKSATNPQFKIAGSNKPSSTSRRELSSLVNGLSASNEEPTLPDSGNSNQLSEPLPPTPMSPLAANPGTTRPESPNQFGTSRFTESFDQRNQAAVSTALGQRNLTDYRDTRNFNAFVQRSEDWKQRNQVPGDPEELPLLVGEYPQKARAARVDAGFVQVNLKVDKNGNIIPESLEVIGSPDGEGVFEEAALAAVRKRAFQATGTEKAYTVRVIFTNNKLVPETSTEPSKTTTERQNSSERITPTESKTQTERQNSSEQLTLPVLTPPVLPIVPKRSTQSERELPLFPQSTLEQSTPSSQKKPGEKPSVELGSPTQQLTPSSQTKPAEKPPTELSSPTQQSTPSSQTKPTEKPPTDLVVPTQQSTPSSQKKPGEKPPTNLVVPTEQSTPSSQKKPGEKPSVELSSPTEQSTPSSQTKPGDKPSVELGSPTQQLTPSSQTKPGDRQTRPERQNSPEPRSSSESSNSEKPPKLSEPPSSEKPLRLPEPPNPAKR